VQYLCHEYTLWLVQLHEDKLLFMIHLKSIYQPYNQIECPLTYIIKLYKYEANLIVLRKIELY
jgi:hypothetical protein